MAKKDKEPLAEEMFVRQLLRVSDIAQRLGLSERTVRTWKRAGDWDTKRREYLYEGTRISDRMQDIAQRVADRIYEMLDEGIVPPRHMFAYLLQVGYGMERARAYEDTMPAAQAEKPSDAPSPETIEKAMQILGLT